MNRGEPSQGRGCLSADKGKAHAKAWRQVWARQGTERRPKTGAVGDSEVQGGRKWGLGLWDQGETQEKWWEATGGVYAGRGASGLTSPAGLLEGGGNPPWGPHGNRVRLIPRSTRQVTLSSLVFPEPQSSPTE